MPTDPLDLVREAQRQISARIIDLLGLKDADYV